MEQAGSTSRPTGIRSAIAILSVVGAIGAMLVVPPPVAASASVRGRAPARAAEHMPPALHRAFETTMMRQAQQRARVADRLTQLSATYTPVGVEFKDRGTNFQVGSPSILQGSSSTSPTLIVRRSPLGAIYRASSIVESFHVVEGGIEQRFVIERASGHQRTLKVRLPVSGLTARTLRGSIELERGKFGFASYSHLMVTDARGKRLASSLSANSTGTDILISVDLDGARFPVTVDPVWSEIKTVTEGDSGTGVNPTEYASSVSLSGNTAIVGAWQWSDAAEGEYGAAYIYTYAPSTNTWSQVAEFHATNGDFGDEVAISGSTAIVSDPNNGTSGQLYVYNDTGGSWTETSQSPVTSSAVYQSFGAQLAFSSNGGEVVAGAQEMGGLGDSGGFVAYSVSNTGVLTQLGNAPTMPPNATVSDGGQSIAISGSDVLVGDGGFSFGSYLQAGGVFPYTLEGSTWVPDKGTSAVVPTDGSYTDHGAFGASVALSGSLAIIGSPGLGADGSLGAGGAYAYRFSLGSLTELSGPFNPPDLGPSAQFGYGISMSGGAVAISAPYEEDNGDTCIVYCELTYVYTIEGDGTAIEMAEVELPYGDDGGQPIAISGSYGIAGVPQNDQFMQFPTTEVSPVGALAVAELRGGGDEGECSCVNASVGQPIDTATGDLYESATDLSLPGPGVPLAFTRTYDAQGAAAEVGHGVPQLGYGWADNLGVSLSYSAPIATLTEENGAQVTFEETADVPSSYWWCTGIANNFCETAPRYNATLENNGSTWTLTRTEGLKRTYTFSSSGALQSVSDDHGSTITYHATYSPGSGQTACPTGDTCSDWTSSTSGSELVLATSTSSSRLVKVFDANSSEAATFAFSTSCGDGSSAELCSAVDPGTLTSSYTYGDGTTGNTGLDYDLVSSQSPGATSATENTYNSSDQVTSQVTPGTGGANDETDLSYGTNGSLTGGNTVVTTYPDGTGSGNSITRTYEYSNYVLVGEFAGSGSTATSVENYTRDPSTLMPVATGDGDNNDVSRTYPTTVVSGTTYDTSPNVLTSKDGDGNVTVTEYNADNEPWCVVVPAEVANGVTCPSTEPTTASLPLAPDAYPGVTITVYNSNNLPVVTTDPLGNTTLHGYTSDNQLYCTIAPLEYATLYATSPSDATCPAYGDAETGVATSTYDSAGDLASSTTPDYTSAAPTTTSYTYSSAYPGSVATVTDPDGQKTTYTYGAPSQVTQRTVTDGSLNSYSATTQYEYSSSGLLYCTVSAADYATGTRCPAVSSGDTAYAGATIDTYDGSGRLIESANPLQGITQYEYDQAGNLYCTVAPAQYASPNSVRCPSLSSGDTSLAGATIDTYNGDDQLTEAANPLTGYTTYQYDAAGNVTQTTEFSNNTSDAPNIVTQSFYDGDGNVVASVVDPSSSTAAQYTFHQYDPDGNEYCTESANAISTDNYFCPEWQPTWISSPPNPTSFYSSTPSSVQANNVTTSFYDADGNLLQTTNPDVDTTVDAVDADGLTYCTSDPTNVATWLSTHSTTPTTELCPSEPTSPPTGTTGYTTTLYDANGNVTSSTDPLGDTTAYSYDSSGNVLTVTDPRGYETTNCYYTASCASTAPAAGGSADMLYSTKTPDTAADPTGEVTYTTYRPGGALEATTTPAGVATDAYDANGDLTSTTYSDAASGYTVPSNLAYTYNVDGTRATMTDNTGVTTYGYDAAGNLTSKSLNASATLTDETTDYSYYENGALDTITYPAYGSDAPLNVTYTYDATGAMSSSEDSLGNEINYGHDLDGNLTAQDNNVSGSYPDGTSSTTYLYDPADALASATSNMAQTCGGAETLTQSFSGSGGSVNPDGQVTEDTTGYTGSCSGQGSTERNYSYDDAGRVTYQGSSGGSSNIAYDAAGDPTTISHDVSGTFDAYSQEFDNAGEVTCQSTASNCTSGTVTDYGYDTLGDLTSATTGSTTTSSGYNQAGQMTSETLGSSSTNELYDGEGLYSGVSNWTLPKDVDGSDRLYSVSCTSSSFCALVDTSGNGVIYNGSSWTRSTGIDSHELESVSCTSSSFCVAVDSAGGFLTWTGSAWSSSGTTMDTHFFDDVSCQASGSTKLCMAVDESGYSDTYNGSTWATKQLAKYEGDFESVSCVSTTLCYGILRYDSESTLYKDTESGGTWTWSSVDNITSNVVDSLSCTATSVCMAVDNQGNTYVYNGSSWSGKGTLGNGDGYVSCSGTTLTTLACVADDDEGNVYSYASGAWSPGQLIDGPHQLDGISCPSTSFCAASDDDGNVMTYTAPSTSTQLTWDDASSLPLVLSDNTYDYVYGPSDTPVEQVNLSTSTPTFMTYTPSDDSWLTTNAAGDQTGFWQYDAFGNPSSGTSTSAFGYAGQWTDATSGLSNMRARWYEPQIGSFTSRDPAFVATDTAYTYASGDPVNGDDPTGLWCWGLCSFTEAGSDVNNWVMDVPGARALNGDVNEIVDGNWSLDQLWSGSDWSSSMNWVNSRGLDPFYTGYHVNNLVYQAVMSGCPVTGSLLLGALFSDLSLGAPELGPDSDLLGTDAAQAAEDAGGLPSVGDTPTKVVNTNMGHASLQAADRLGFGSVSEARSALQELGHNIESDGFPEGTIPDTSRGDRLLVPFGEGGYAVYQIMANGNAVLKTVLIQRPPVP